ncbi:hypothetical protein N2152v2_001911 [Parachlorella kessleri]
MPEAVCRGNSSKPASTLQLLAVVLLLALFLGANGQQRRLVSPTAPPALQAHRFMLGGAAGSSLPDADSNPATAAPPEDAYFQGRGQPGGQRQCSIYVLDASKELAPLDNVPPCHVSDTKYWPHDQPGRGLDGSDRTPHHGAQHSSIFWIAKAIRDSGYLAPDIDSADLVFVDSHCYIVRRTAQLPARQAAQVVDQSRRVLVDALGRHARFAASTNGSGFVFGVPFPALFEAYSQRHACSLLRHAFMLAVEKATFCKDDKDKARDGRSLILPYPATLDVPETVSFDDRPTFLFTQGSCPWKAEVLKIVSSGKLLRRALVLALAGTSPDIQLHCASGTSRRRMDHGQMMQGLQRSLFCPVIAGDTQSSRRLTEIVLAGCIPVFIGPPFHTLPLAADIDYPSFSVFVNMTNTTDWVYTQPYEGRNLAINMLPVLRMWSLDADIRPTQMRQATSFADMLQQLRAIPPAAVHALQQALAQERGKFMFAPLPGQQGTPLTDIVLQRLCDHADQLQRTRAASKQTWPGTVSSR